MYSKNKFPNGSGMIFRDVLIAEFSSDSHHNLEPEFPGQLFNSFVLCIICSATIGKYTNICLLSVLPNVKSSSPHPD